MVSIRRCAVRWCRVWGLVLLLVGLSACSAIPPVVSKLSMLSSTVSYVATSKGPSDHAVSLVMKMDCSVLRLILFKPMCLPITEQTNQSLWAKLTRKREEVDKDAGSLPDRHVVAR